VTPLDADGQERNPRLDAAKRDATFESSVNAALPPLRARLRWMHRARLTCAVLLALAALSHALQAALGARDIHRHELFVGINGVLALLIVTRPRWSLWPLAVLTVQQIQSHGTALVRSIQNPSAAFDWTSLAVLAFFPMLIALLAIEWRLSDPHGAE
jgi:hypothetical protein